MDGEMIVDVREYPEFAAGHIEASRLVPLARVRAEASTWDRDAALTLVCKTGRRAEQARQQLAAMGFKQAAVLDGGIDRWREQGKPLTALARKPWSMERQVRVAAGSLVVLTVIAGVLVSRYFLMASGLVGAGLVFAGVSNICMMASLLAKLPWNKPARVKA